MRLTFLSGHHVEDLSPFVAFAIITNSLIIFIDATPEFHLQGNTFLKWLDYCCALVFLFEAASKILSFGWSNYIKRNWNRFDLTLVILSSPVLLLPIVNVEAFGVLLTLRWARLIRFLKILAFIPNRERLLDGSIRALKSSVGVFFGLIFLLIFASLSGTMLFGEVSPEMFGNPFISAYSMFKIFTIEGWFEIPAILEAANHAPWWGIFVKAYFIAFVIAGGLIGITMLNAVFVDALVEDNTYEIENRLEKIEKKLEKILEQKEEKNKSKDIKRSE